MEPYEGGPGPERDAEEPVERVKLHEVTGCAFAPLVVGYISLALALIFIVYGGLLVGTERLSSLLTWAVVTLPVVAINLVFLWRYSRRIRTPLGKAVSRSAAVGAAAAMIALSLIAVVISVFSCAFVLGFYVG